MINTLNLKIKLSLKHGFEYVGIKNDYHLDLVRGNPTWWKFSILKEWIEQGRIKQ